MTSAVAQEPSVARRGRVQIGANGQNPVGFDATIVELGLENPMFSAVRASGSDVDRAGRSDVATFALDSGQTGFKAVSQIRDWGQDKTAYTENTGIYGTWLPGIGCLSYVTTVSTTLASVDVSGYNDANKRVHSFVWPTASGIRTGWLIGPNLFITTSVSNPAPKAPGTADNITNNVLSCWVGINSSGNLALYIGTDGTTDDIKYTEDPTASSISWTSAVTYSNSADRAWWGYYSKTMRRHVVAGIINNVAEIYAFKDSDSEPLTSSTVQPVVWGDTKNLLGDVDAVTLTSKAAGFCANDGTGSVSDPGSIAGTQANVWINTSNGLASDDSYVTYALPSLTAAGTINFQTSYLDFDGFDISSMPRGAFLIGAQFGVEWSASSTTALSNLVLYAQLILDGSPTGLVRSADLTVSTTDATKNLGSTSDKFGLGDTSGFSAIGVRIWFTGTRTSGTSQGSISLRVDTTTLANFKYQFPGYKTHVNQGSHGCGELATQPDLFAALEPEVNDATGMLVPRRAVTYQFSLDGASDRVVLAARTYLDAQAPYVGDVYPYQGFLAAAVGQTGSLWDHIRQITSAGVTTDLNHPAINGADPQHVTKLSARGDFLLEDGCDTDNTDAQLLGYAAQSGRQYGVGAAQSLSTAPAARPLYWAEAAGRLDEQNSYHYRFYPDGSSHLAVAYEFVPPNMYDDPFLFNTTIVKTDGAPRLVFVELNKGAPEANKADTVAQIQTRYCDDKTDFGTVKLEGDTGGDETLASPALTVTFGSDADPFVEYNLVTAANQPGIQHRTMVYGLTADHTSGTAKTPNIFPVVLFMPGKFKQMRTFTIILTPESWHEHAAFLDTLQTNEDTAVVQYVAITSVPLEPDKGVGQGELIFKGVCMLSAPDAQTRSLLLRQKPGANTLGVAA